MRFSSTAFVITALLAGSLVSTTTADAAPRKISGTTTVGVHNTYDTAAYDYLARALDAGSSLIELDVWPDVFTHEWKVSHSNPLGHPDNCVSGTSPTKS